MDQAVYELGREQYRIATGYADMDRDEDGFVILKPTASRVDARKAELTTSIDDLESKLRAFRAEKAEVTRYQKTDEYKESKKKGRSKKEKKARASLLNMVFNNADALAEEEESEDEEGYRDGRKPAKKRETTLDTTYGKRFSPVVSMLHDTISDFDAIAKAIEEEINSNRGSARNMYRSQQIANLISAKNSKLSAVRELGSIAKTVSDLEYKRDKEKKGGETDTTRLISSLGAKYLRGDFDIDDDRGSKGGKKGKKGKDKDKGDSSFKKATKGLKRDDDDDDDGEVGSIERPGSSPNVMASGRDKKKKGDKSCADRDEDIAKAFAEEIKSRKGEFSFSPHEMNLKVEGKYIFVVACDPMDPEHTWKYVAVDPKTGKAIKDFKEKYKELYPKKRNARMRFDIAKKKCSDLNTGRSYKLIFSD